MNTRIHTADAATAGIEICRTQRLVDLYGDDFEDTTTAAVIEDGRNGEALVLTGDRDDLIKFARDLLARVEAMPT